MPIDTLRWGSEGGLKTEPSERLKDNGYEAPAGVGEKPVLNYDNYWKNQVYQNVSANSDAIANLEISGGGNGGGSFSIIANGDFGRGYANWFANNGASEFEQKDEPNALSDYVGQWTPSATDSTFKTDNGDVVIRIANDVGFISFDYRTDSDKFLVEVWEYVDGGDDVLKAQYPIPEYPSTTDYVNFKNQVGMGEAGQQLYVKFTCPTTDGTSDVITLSNVMLGTQSATVGGIITEWEDFTPELVGCDPSNFEEVKAAYQRVGENLNLKLNLTSKNLISDTGVIDIKIPKDITVFDEGYPYIASFGNYWVYRIGATDNAQGQGVVQAFNKSGYIHLNIYAGAITKGDENGSSGDERFLHWDIFTRAKGQLILSCENIPIQQWRGEGVCKMLEVDKQSPDMAGQVIAWSGVNTPSGWLACDGSTHLKTKYPDLYSSIGDVYNEAEYIDDAGDVQTYPAPGDGFFRIPDYRNVYLRGSGGAYINGDILDDSTAVNGLNGSFASADHTHSSNNMAALLSYTSSSGRIGYVKKSVSSYTVTSATPKLENFTNEALVRSEGILVQGNTNAPSKTSTITGDEETRPKTAAVGYIIRCWNTSGSAIGLPKATANEYGVVALNDEFKAKPDSYGLVRANRVQTKYLDSDVNVKGTFLQFNNLKSDVYYRLDFNCRFSTSDGAIQYIYARHSGAVIQIIVSTTVFGNYSKANSIIFKASSSVVTLDSDVDNTGLKGYGNGQGTMAQLTELNNYEETTDFT